jgi:hypothetical protein
MTNQNINDLHYLAGLIDGEGHICYLTNKNGRGEPHTTMRIIFVQSKNNNGLRCCEWIKERYGGNISGGKKDFGKLRDASKKEENPMYRWTLQGENAFFLCKQLLPLVIVKTRQISNVMALYSENKRLKQATKQRVCA